MGNIKWINQSVKVLNQENTITGLYKKIEVAGRTCYKSLDKITDDSCFKFVNSLIKSEHYAMLEHATVYLSIPYTILHRMFHPGLCRKYMDNKYTKTNLYHKDTCLDYLGNIMINPYLAITTNLRVIVENGWDRDLKYICNPTPYHELRYSVLCTTNLQVSLELVRHRVMSFANESSRYCNYSKDKFGNQLVFIKPNWFEVSNKQDITLEEDCLRIIESTYLRLIEHGWKPQQAAQVLPKALKTDIVITGFKSDWDHFMDLRYWGTTGAPHPQMKELASLILLELNHVGYTYGDKGIYLKD